MEAEGPIPSGPTRLVRKLLKNMFTKIDKKVLIVAIVVLLLVLGVVFFAYTYLVSGKKDLNSNNSQATQQQTIQAPQDNTQENNPIIEELEKPQIQFQNPTIGTQEKGSLMICADKCGDGICQKAGEVCPENDHLNCACGETIQECPQDCPAN